MRVEPHHTAGELAGFIRSESRGKVARRLTAVRLALLGYSAAQVAAQVLLSERQVRTWVARYNADPAGGLADRAGRGRKPRSTPARRPAWRPGCGPDPGPPPGLCALRGEDVRRVLRKEFGVARCLQAVYNLLHRLGFEPLRPRHPSASAEAQAAFKKAPDRLAEVAAARPGQSVEVWSEDEARFGQQGIPTTVWADKGSRPAAPKQTAYANVHSPPSARRPGRPRGRWPRG